MQAKALFRQLETKQNLAPKASVLISINGQEVAVAPDISVAAALLTYQAPAMRINLADHSLRGPYCMMGVCFECLVTIDDMPNVQSCMVQVYAGMKIQTTLTVTE